MLIFFKNLSNKIIPLRVKPYDTIKEVKIYLEYKQNLPPDQMKLVYNRECLEDDRTLSSYNITSESTVHLLIRLDGPSTVCMKGMKEKEAEENQKSGIDLLSDNLKDLFLSARDTDVTIRVGDQEFEAHRSILVARSQVFAAMFEHDMAEKKSKLIDIEDCDPRSFKDFLLYLYTGKLDKASSNNAHDLYKTADKYQLDELKKTCVECMKSNMTVDSFCDALLISAMYSEDELRQTATDFFARNIKEILVTPKWQLFHSENPSLVDEVLLKLANYVTT